MTFTDSLLQKWSGLISHAEALEMIRYHSRIHGLSCHQDVTNCKAENSSTGSLLSESSAVSCKQMTGSDGLSFRSDILSSSLTCWTTFWNSFPRHQHWGQLGCWCSGQSQQRGRSTGGFYLICWAQTVTNLKVLKEAVVLIVLQLKLEEFQVSVMNSMAWRMLCGT